MPGPESGVNEYLARVGIRKITELDMALVGAFGQEEGARHIARLTELFDQSEDRVVNGTGSTPYLHRQEELVDYLNQSFQMSLLAASFYDRVFFRRAMEYLAGHDFCWGEEIFDIGSGNGILTCFLALSHPGSSVTGLELSPKAVAVAETLAEMLQAGNVHFRIYPEIGAPRQKPCDTLLSCRTVRENVAWRALRTEALAAALSAAEQAKLHGAYARQLSALVKAGGYLVSVERYEEDDAYAGLLMALEHAGFSQARGTAVQFSCRNGDGTATFQARIFQKR